MSVCSDTDEDFRRCILHQTVLQTVLDCADRMKASEVESYHFDCCFCGFSVSEKCNFMLVDDKRQCSDVFRSVF